MRRRWVWHLLLFVSLVPLFGGSGCVAKVRRACEVDADCAGSAPNVYCDVEGFCNVRQCNSGTKRPCYRGNKGCTRDAIGGTYTCQGSCKAGVQICEANGLWSLCFGDQVPSVEICDLLDNDCDGQTDNVEGGIASCQCQDKGKERPCFAGTTASSGIGECRAGVQICTDQNRWGACRDQALPSPEICDGKDNDCNGKIDDTTEGCFCADGDTRACYTGPQGTLGVGICRAGIQVCQNNRWDGACLNQILPTTEDCNTPLDEDCNGQPNNGCACAQGLTDCTGNCVDTTTDLKHCGACGTACKDGEICKNGVCSCVDSQERSCYTGPQGTLGKGICRSGIQVCKNNQWESTCVGEILPATEYCNGVDDDCDGKTDNGCECKPGDQQDCYNGPPGTLNVGVCKAGKATCQPDGTWSPCQGETLPATEVCNGVDDDCDGNTDEEVTRLCKQQQGVCAGAIETCTNGTFAGCAGPQSFGAVYEGTEHTCDGRDNDCDGKTDEAPDGSDLCRDCIPTTRNDALSFGTFAKNILARFAFRWDGLQFASVDATGSLRFFFLGNPSAFTPSLSTNLSTSALLAWSPVGYELALHAQDGSILLLDTRSYLPIQTLKQNNQIYAHNGGPQRFVWSPDGKLLASAGGASDTYTLRVWDAQNGTERFSLSGHTNTITGLAFDRTSRKLISASADQSIRVWDMNNGMISQNKPMSAVIHALAIHPTKDEIAVAHGATAATPSQIHILSLNNLNDPPKALRQQIVANITKLAYNRNGKLLSSIEAFPSTHLNVWETTDWNVVSTLYSDAYAFRDFVWNPTKDELLAASEGDDRYLYFSCPQICNQFALKSQNALYTSTNPVKGLGMTANQDFLVWWTANGNLHRANPPQDLAKVTNHTAVRADISAFSVYPSLSVTPGLPNFLLLLYGTTTSAVSSARNNTFSIQENASNVTPHTSAVSAVAWSPHTGIGYLLSADTSGKIKAWNYFKAPGTPWPQVHEWSEHTAAINGLAFAPNGYSFASASDDGTIQIRDLEKFNTTATIALQESGSNKPHGAAVKAVTWSRDGKWLATAGVGATGTHTIKLWDGRTYNQIRTFTTGTGTGHTGLIRSLTFHPEGHLLASGSDDNDIRVWEVSSGALVAVLGRNQSGHAVGVNALVWSSDGKALYSGGGDGRVIHWECR